jgi:glucose-6-phosphate dehydrogenase assembly protein OpcA
MAVAPGTLEHWVGEDVSLAEVERQLGEIRAASADQGYPLLRTSVMTHLAWVPEPWLPAARAVLAGMGERHPSRTIVLVPHPRARRNAIDASISLECFPLEAAQICTEVIELRLQGRRAEAPATIVTPLLIFDLPVFLRWRGPLPFGSPPLEQLVGVTDRLVLDSGEWPDPAAAYPELPAYFGRAAVSDIAWARTLGWRRQLAQLWPGIRRSERLRVLGPAPEALLLAGWLRARLRRDVRLEHVPSSKLEAVHVDGEPVQAPPGEPKTASDLLSDELDSYARDRIYEEAVTRAADS